ncbi:hypothetical protein [Microbulbifer sp. PAAF003]|uniref:hypothetical protein n=1 Tax=Microbulbifer sp. PAAF003 TaxID=3243375 RepID=UPI00403A24CB
MPEDTQYVSVRQKFAIVCIKTNENLGMPYADQSQINWQLTQKKKITSIFQQVTDFSEMKIRSIF